MIQEDHIKYEREYQGKSLRMIAQETSYDFRTVKKYADCDDWNEPILMKLVINIWAVVQYIIAKHDRNH